MINKIAESHFNTLRMAPSSAIQIDEGKKAASPDSPDALDNFMSTPSFNTKQIAIESFMRQITQGSSSFNGKTGTTG